MKKAPHKFSEKFISILIEQNFTELRGIFSYLPKASIYGEPGLIWIDSQINYPGWNTVFWTRLTSLKALEKIYKIKKYFSEKMLPFVWWIGPSTQPENLENLLLENGFVHTEDSPGMAFELVNNDVELEKIDNFKIKQIKQIPELYDFVKIIKESYELPALCDDALITLFSELNIKGHSPFSHYLGYYQEKPVATASLFRAAGVGGIHFIATLSEYRGRGFGRAMTIFAMQQAKLMGYSLAVLRASQMGETIYKNIGFKEYCRLNKFSIS
jgi:GNAT superfamily N-acetyltransferase